MQVHRIELPTPLPVGPVNAYLLAGDPLTLVDTGPKTDAAQGALEAGVVAAGYRLESVQRIILTHGHSDHFGNAAWVQSRSGATILAHPADRPKYAGERWVTESLRRHFTAAGLPDSFLETFTVRIRELRLLFDPVAFSPIEDGDAVTLNGDDLRVLHTPGHSIGHLCLYHGDGVLVAGDLLLADISPNPVVEFDARGERIATLPQYLHSLRRILLLNCEVAHPGHGTAIANPSARIRELIAHHEQRKEHIAAKLSGKSKTLVELTHELYQGLDDLNFMLALSEVVGHLDLLSEDKRLSVSKKAGVLRYRAK